eukprot:s430_g1.t2
MIMAVTISTISIIIIIIFNIIIIITITSSITITTTTTATISTITIIIININGNINIIIITITILVIFDFALFSMVGCCVAISVRFCVKGGPFDLKAAKVKPSDRGDESVKTERPGGKGGSPLAGSLEGRKATVVKHPF